MKTLAHRGVVAECWEAWRLQLWLVKPRGEERGPRSLLTVPPLLGALG